MPEQNVRKKLWFGTEQHAEWMATPLNGGDSSPESWGVSGTFINGGGYGFHAFDSHKRYVYEWPGSSSRETAQKFKSFRDGTYGRGLLYFHDPLTFDTNVLPARWADPSMAIGGEAPSLVYGVTPTATPTPLRDKWGLPVRSAVYDLTDVPTVSPSDPTTRLFVIIPENYTLFLGAFYSATGSGGVYATPLNMDGSLGTTVRITASDNDTDDVFQDSFSGVRGVYVQVGKTAAGAASVTLSAMIGRLIPTSDVVVYGPWEEQFRNLATNPSFEVDINIPAGATRSTDWAASGSYSIYVPGTAGYGHGPYGHGTYGHGPS